MLLPGDAEFGSDEPDEEAGTQVDARQSDHLGIVTAVGHFYFYEANRGKAPEQSARFTAWRASHPELPVNVDEGGAEVPYLVFAAIKSREGRFAVDAVGRPVIELLAVNLTNTSRIVHPRTFVINHV